MSDVQSENAELWPFARSTGYAPFELKPSQSSGAAGSDGSVKPLDCGADHQRRTILSADRVYRYVLWREWDMLNADYLMMIGLNPSTADETKDDPTIRKCVGFAKRWGFGALCMTNLFAFRATNPRVMKGSPKPIGEQNDRWLTACARDAARIIAAWGVHGEFMARDEEVLKLIDGVECLRRTKQGFPEHPLYVPYETEPQSYAGRYESEQAGRAGSEGLLSAASGPTRSGTAQGCNEKLSDGCGSEATTTPKGN